MKQNTPLTTCVADRYVSTSAPLTSSAEISRVSYPTHVIFHNHTAPRGSVATRRYRNDVHWNRLRRVVIRQPEQPAGAQVVDNLELRQQRDPVAGAGGDVHDRTVVGLRSRPTPRTVIGPPAR